MGPLQVVEGPHSGLHENRAPVERASGEQGVVRGSSLVHLIPQCPRGRERKC